MNRLHPLSALNLAASRGIIGLTIPLTLWFMVSAVTDLSTLWVLVLAPLGAAVGVAHGIAYFLRFTYEFTAETFDLNSGVIARRAREIPYRRVQNVDINQPLLHRLLGLAIVKIETAGGGETEATLNFVSDEEAREIQRQIRRRTAQETISEETPDAKEESPEPSVLFELEPRELILYSGTAIRPAAGAAVAFLGLFAAEPILELLISIAAPFGGPAELGDGPPISYVILGVISLLNVVIVSYLISVAYAFTTYYGFQLGRSGGDFVYERGLLQRYSGSIPAEKVQSVTITDNPLQRAIGYAGAYVETAGYGPDSSGGSQSAIPLATADRVGRFTERLTGVETPTFTQPPRLARRRYLARYSIVAAAIVLGSFLLSRVITIEWWYLSALAFLIAPPAAFLRYRHLGYFLGDDHLVIRRGFWRRRTTVIPYYRVQTVATRRSIFQRRLGLASLIVDTASSQTFIWPSPTIYDITLEVGNETHRTIRDRLQASLTDGDEEPGVSVDFT